MFLSISLPLSRNLTPSLSYQIVRKRIAKVTDFLSFCPFGISIFPFCTIGISMYQKRILPYIIIPYFLTPSFFPFGALQTDKSQHPPIPYFFFFPLSARGPTRRRNSTGLAELWGGWPIEPVKFRYRKNNWNHPLLYSRQARPKTNQWCRRISTSIFNRVVGKNNY
jgi:hypothetical protein